MITTNLIFFSDGFHEKIYRRLGVFSDRISEAGITQPGRVLKYALVMYFGIQVLMPFRHFLYPSNVLVTEEGYRFSWRVMLLEKSGIATFTIRDKSTGRSSEIINSEYLTDFQEKQMAIQPDFMVQYAKHLATVYQGRVHDPEVTVHSVVSMNGHASRPFIDRNIDLSSADYSLQHKNWVKSW
jgi:hypothetical protein